MPLSHLEREIRLDGDVCLRSIPNAELGEIQESFYGWYGRDARWTPVYEIFKEVECTREDSWLQAMHDFDEILGELRLLQPGRVDIARLSFTPTCDAERQAG